jgi:hypothetical protein
MSTDDSRIENVAEFPEPSYWGGCPECRRNDGYRNLGREHWFSCHRHQVRWCAGENLFSSWRHESEEDWARNRARIGPYRVVECYPWPNHVLGLED